MRSKLAPRHSDVRPLDETLHKSKYSVNIGDCYLEAQGIKQVKWGQLGWNEKAELTACCHPKVTMRYSLGAPRLRMRQPFCNHEGKTKGITEIPVNSPDILVPLKWPWNCPSLTFWHLRKINPCSLSHWQTGILLPAAKRILTDAADFMGKRVSSAARLPGSKVGLYHLLVVWLGEVNSPLWALI